jgi:hypothetical protein
MIIIHKYVKMFFLAIRMRTLSKLLVLAFSIFPYGIGHAQSFSDYTADDKRLLWEEAAYTHNGLSYQYVVYTFSSEEDAITCTQTKPSCLLRLDPRESYILAKKQFDQGYHELPLHLKERIGSMEGSELSTPIKASDGQGWIVIQLVKKTGGTLRGAANTAQWLETFAPTALPTPAALRTSPDLVLRQKLNRIRNQEDLLRAITENGLTGKQLDSQLSNGSTLLIRAIFRDDAQSIIALLENGADVDLCALRTCPLTTAVTLKNLDLVRLLLKHKANPSGGAADITPLMAASYQANKVMAEILIDAGASPLDSRRVALGSIKMVRSTLFYAPSDKPDYLVWLQKESSNALDKIGKFKWLGWVEQGKQRMALSDGATLTLKRAPFSIVMRMNPAAGFRVVASEDILCTRESRTPCSGVTFWLGIESEHRHPPASILLPLSACPTATTPRTW